MRQGGSFGAAQGGDYNVTYPNMQIFILFAYKLHVDLTS